MTRRAPQDDDSFDPDDYVFRRDKNGLHVNLDKLLLYSALSIVVVIGLVVAAIKAIRWAVTS